MKANVPHSIRERLRLKKLGLVGGCVGGVGRFGLDIVDSVRRWSNRYRDERSGRSERGRKARIALMLGVAMECRPVLLV